MLVADFDFELPKELIAQEALPERAQSRLLVLDRETGTVTHAQFFDLQKFLRAGDLLVVNNSRVFPSRLLGQSNGSGVECFLLRRLGDNLWQALMRPGRKMPLGSKMVCQAHGATLEITVMGKDDSGKFTVALSAQGQPVDEALELIGHVPLPPYINRPDVPADRQRYQTVYAKPSGSVAAPTAGLHFTPELLQQLQAAGIEVAEITLHVGYGTFKPVTAVDAEDHVVDPELYEISPAAAAAVNQTLDSGRRVIAVGTTTTRVLEYSAGLGRGRIVSGHGETSLFIRPGYEFKVISGLVTNFHLPKSSLLMLVSAFAGREQVLSAYGQAVSRRYRFFSYGDAMLII